MLVENPSDSGKIIKVFSVVPSHTGGFDAELYRASWDGSNTSLDTYNLNGKYSDATSLNAEQGTSVIDTGSATRLPPSILSPSGTGTEKGAPPISSDVAYTLDEGDVLGVRVTPEATSELNVSVILAEYEEDREF